MMMIVVFLCNYDLFAIARSGPGIKVEEHYLATAIAMKSKNELVFTLRIVQEMIWKRRWWWWAGAAGWEMRQGR